MYTSLDVVSADAHVEAQLVGMTLDELSHLQDVLLEELSTGMPSREQIAKALERQSVEVAEWFRFRQTTGEAVKIVMLLGALAVAIAWMTHRHVPAPPNRLQEAMARVREDHVYMLPIPRSDPCFCGSGSRFRSCHGRPPLAAPAI